MAGELQHKDAGVGLTRTEDNAVERHELDSGVEGDFIYWDATALCFKRIAHAADQTIHFHGDLTVVRTGEYENFYATYASAKAIAANTLYAIPFLVPRNKTFDRIAIRVTTLAAGASARLGIYNNDGTNLYPGTRKLDAGTVSVASTGVKAITLDPVLSLTKGLYFLVLVSDGIPSLNYSLVTMTPLGALATDPTWGNQGWKVAFTYAALPTPFTAGGSLVTEQAPLVVLRLLSLD